MSQSIEDREATTKDSSEVFKYTFDYDDALPPGVELVNVGTVTITPSTGAPTQANLALTGGNRVFTVFLAGGTAGKIFTVEHTVQTNEVTPQTFSPWFKLRIT